MKPVVQSHDICDVVQQLPDRAEYIFTLPREHSTIIGLGALRRIAYYADRIELEERGRVQRLALNARHPLRQVAEPLDSGYPAFWMISSDLNRRSLDPQMPLIMCVQAERELMLGGSLADPNASLRSTAGPFAGWETEDDESFRRRIAGSLETLGRYPQGKMIVTRPYQRRVPNAADPLRLFAIFAAAERAAAASHYLRVAPGITSLGCSPENVFELKDGNIAFDVVAGTRGISADPRTDAVWRHELQTCAKERREHMLAFERYEAQLKRITLAGSARIEHQREILELGKVRHLYSRISGRLSPSIHLLDLLEGALPPLAGYPEAVRKLEDDGSKPLRYYGGIVGRTEPGWRDARFFLNLRSAVIKGNTLYTQAGVGLVCEADADKEVLEVQNKLRGLLIAVKQWEGTQPGQGMS
jgi:anthranilate/para-aminobenzoate synthase component I